MSCLTLQRCCLYKCTVGKCAYSSAFVYNSLTRRSVDVLKRAVVFFFAKSLGLAAMLYVFICLSLSLHKHLQHCESEMENISRWTQSATAHVHIHTQACYKTSPMLIFTGLSVSLPLQNPIRETCCIKGSIKGFRKSLRRSAKNMSALGVPSACFCRSPTHLTLEIIYKYVLEK